MRSRKAVSRGGEKDRRAFEQAGELLAVPDLRSLADLRDVQIKVGRRSGGAAVAAGRRRPQACSGDLHVGGVAAGGDSLAEVARGVAGDDRSDRRQGASALGPGGVLGCQ